MHTILVTGGVGARGENSQGIPEEILFSYVSGG
jgi:hypothetical protein